MEIGEAGCDEETEAHTREANWPEDIRREKTGTEILPAWFQGGVLSTPANTSTTGFSVCS